MVSISSTVEVSGDALGPLIARLGDLTEGLDEAGAVLMEGVPVAFDRGDRGEWAPLADWTVNERRAQGFGGEHPILIRTGSYLASFQIDESGYGEGAVAISSDDPRFQTLNAGGTTETGKTVPARPVVITEEFVDAAGDAFWAWLVKD